MIRNLKALGLALMATLAFSAVAASGASAEENIFDSAVANTISTGTSETNQVFTRGVGSFNCSHLALESTQAGFSVSTIQFAADYTTTSCTGPLNSQLHVDFITSECGLHLTGTASKTAQVKLACNKPGGSMMLTATNSDGSSLCTVHLPQQTVGGHVVFTNVKHNNISSVTSSATLTNIASTRTGSPLCGPENHATATYNGNFTTTGYEDIEGNEGNQVAVEVT